MSLIGDETPFLADNDHDGEDHVIKSIPANTHFKRPLRILSAINSMVSGLTFALLIATIILIQSGPYYYTYDAVNACRDLAITIGINFIFAIPAIFIDIPIWLNLASNLALSIVAFVFSANIFGRGWPDSSFCRRWAGPPNYGQLPAEPKCLEGRSVIMVCMAVAGGVGMLVGLLLLTSLLLRIIAVARTKLWQQMQWKGMSWNHTGFTVQFTLSVLPHDPKRQAVSSAASNTEEARLVDA